MKRTRAFKVIRIVVSVLCLFVSALFAVLWMRSYYTRDSIHGRTSHTRRLHVRTLPGWIAFTTVTTSNPTNVHQWRIAVGEDAGHDVPQSWREVFRSFDWGAGANGMSVRIPCWFLVLAAATFAAVPWITWRFSIRTLLIGTAMFAVLLALIAAVAR